MKIEFNKVFNAFILGGMTIAVILATALKYDDSAENTVRWMLLVSAFGSLMGVLSTVCSANGRIWTFLFGFLDVSIYAVMCFVGAKYGNAILHAIYFVPMQFVGYFQWRNRGADSGRKVEARRLSGKQRMLCGLVLFLGSMSVWLLLHRFSPSNAAAFDAISVVCNILGQFLMTTAFMEQWILWIGVNIASILMWSITLHSDPSSSYSVIYILKYSFYLINSFNGLRIWISLSRNKKP